MRTLIELRSNATIVMVLDTEFVIAPLLVLISSLVRTASNQDIRQRNARSPALPRELSVRSVVKSATSLATVPREEETFAETAERRAIGRMTAPTRELCNAETVTSGGTLDANVPSKRTGQESSVLSVKRWGIRRSAAHRQRLRLMLVTAAMAMEVERVLVMVPSLAMVVLTTPEVPLLPMAVILAKTSVLLLQLLLPVAGRSLHHLLQVGKRSTFDISSHSLRLSSQWQRSRVWGVV